MNILMQALTDDPVLAGAIALAVLLTASLTGGIGRTIFLAFMTWKLARMAVLFGAGAGLYALFA